MSRTTGPCGRPTAEAADQRLPTMLPTVFLETFLHDGLERSPCFHLAVAGCTGLRLNIGTAEDVVSEALQGAVIMGMTPLMPSCDATVRIQDCGSRRYGTGEGKGADSRHSRARHFNQLYALVCTHCPSSVTRSVIAQGGIAGLGIYLNINRFGSEATFRLGEFDSAIVCLLNSLFLRSQGSKTNVYVYLGCCAAVAAYTLRSVLNGAKKD